MRAVFSFSLTVILLVPAAAQDPLPDRERGRQIYRSGAATGGEPITAEFGRNGPQVSATGAPCINCHGRDGLGRPEGGVKPSDIRWPVLAREIPSANSQDVRARPAYTERLLVRAITMGLDSGGAALNPVMPQYRISSGDARNLAAYLATLGAHPDPGVLETAIRVGAILPPRNDAAPGLGQAIRQALSAYFEDAGHRSPIFGRVVEVRFLELPQLATDRPAAVQAFLNDEGIFALVAGFLAGSEREIGGVLEDLGVPLINAVSASPPVETNRYVFYLDGGIRAQTTALTASVLESGAARKPRITLLVADGAAEQQAAAEASASLQESQWPQVERLAIGDRDWLRKLRQGGTGTTMVLTRLLSFKDLAALPGVLFLVPGAFLPPDSTDLPLAEGTRIRTAFPVLPSDFERSAVAEYESLAQRYHLPATGLQAQRSALCGARILLELLMRAGRDVTREKLIDLQEDLREFSTGWSPRLSYGRGDHIGIGAPHVFEIRSEATKK